MAGRKLKGTVTTQSDRGWLRLAWTYQRRRFRLSLGLMDTPGNRLLAQQKAQVIEADIRAELVSPGHFDPSLGKYRAEALGHPLAVAELVEQYIEWKRKTLEPESLQKYWGLLGSVRQFFKSRAAHAISEATAFEFRDWLLGKVEAITARERIGILRSCWRWGLKRNLVKSNPWEDVRVKVPPKPRPRPFTQEEIKAILGRAQSAPKYEPYADLIEFCFAVGCRPGEAAGLKWSHLTKDCREVWIGESWGRGRQKSTKTNQSRGFELTDRLQAMLKQRQQGSDGEYVFTAPKGGPVDDHNFRRRCWKPLLKELDIPYRMPRRTRATFISHALDQGWSVSEIAAVTGNSEETILRSYVGNPRGRTKLREVF